MSHSLRNEVLNSNHPVLLDFRVPWCDPCRMVSPIVDEIAAERSDIKVGKIGGIEEPEELPLHPPESFFSHFRVDMKVHHDVKTPPVQQRTGGVL